MTSIRVAVMNSEHLIRAGIAALLTAEPDFTVVADADDLETAMVQVSRAKPDVILADCHTGGAGPGRALRLLRRAAPASRILLLVPLDSDQLLSAALAAGAVGCVTRNLSAQALFASIRQAASAPPVLTPAAPDVDSARRVPSGVANFARALTPREREVIRLVCQGLYNHEISRSLGISPNTVKTHLRNILAKLRVSNRIQVVALSQQYSGLLDWTDPIRHDAQKVETSHV